MSTERIPAAARRKIERLERENEELRAEIAKHMDVYRETLYELVTYKVRVEQCIKLLQGVDE
jgi:uncharacterized protein (UPF0335 family)